MVFSSSAPNDIAVETPKMLEEKSSKENLHKLETESRSYMEQTPKDGKNRTVINVQKQETNLKVDARYECRNGVLKGF